MVARLGLTDVLTLCDVLKEVREPAMCVSEKKAFPGRGNGRCKGPEVETCCV